MRTKTQTKKEKQRCRVRDRDKWRHLERQKKSHLSDIAQDQLHLCPVCPKLQGHRCGSRRPWGGRFTGRDQQATLCPNRRYRSYEQVVTSLLIRRPCATCSYLSIKCVFSSKLFKFFFFGCRKVLKEISVGGLNPNETVQASLEAQLLSKLDHPAIVKFHASFVERDNFCIITEYCEVRLPLFFKI